MKQLTAYRWVKALSSVERRKLFFTFLPTPSDCTASECPESQLLHRLAGRRDRTGSYSQSEGTGCGSPGYGAHRAHHVIDDALFGVDEAGGILVDLDPAPSSTG